MIYTDIKHNFLFLRGELAQFPKRKVGDCGVESPRFGEVSVYSARVNIGRTILTSPLDIGGLRFPLATHNES